MPGSPDESKLFERVRKGEMPDGGPPLPKDEQDTLKKWIDAGAPPFAAETKRVFISPVEMLSLMLKDLEKANERDRPFLRYFTLTHLHNAGFEDNELESHRQGLSKLVNSLSWGREIKAPQPIDSAKTILRIDLRHYKWNENADHLRRPVSRDVFAGRGGEVLLADEVRTAACACQLVCVHRVASAALQPDSGSPRDAGADAVV